MASSGRFDCAQFRPNQRVAFAFGKRHPLGWVSYDLEAADTLLVDPKRFSGRHSEIVCRVKFDLDRYPCDTKLSPSHRRVEGTRAICFVRDHIAVSWELDPGELHFGPLNTSPA